MKRYALPAPSGWTHLPREARDTLFQLAVVAWTILPHTAHLAPWCTALAAVLLVWRGWLALTNAAMPGRAAVIAVLAVAIGLTLITERTLLGKEAGVSMLVVLLALKMMEVRGRRDALVVFFLGFFLTLTQCLYSQSLLIALSMAGSAWGLLTAQVLASMPVGKPSLARAAGISARTALLGLPLMAALFLLFPRIGPLWGLPQDAVGRTGLSGTLRMGSVADLANDDAIAFRIRFDDAVPAASSLYFRGPVLSIFDGQEWRSSPPSPAARSAPELRPQGTGIGYEMILEPIRLSLLPLLEATPPHADGLPMLPGWGSTLDAQLRWQTDRIIAERVQLRARAWPRFEHGPLAQDDELTANTLLPSGGNPRAVQWAGALRSQPRLAVASADVLAAELMRHIRTEQFSYTLTPGSYGRDAVDEFWFDRRQGFCEHFAVSFVVMMRAMGVPARVVSGYQGAESPDADGWRVVRQSNAHAWAEYWAAGHGWRRADPTAAVAPERVSASRSLVPPAGLMAGALHSMNPELADELRRLWERMDNRWNQWVMGYSRTRQFDLLQSLGVETPSWRDLLVLLLSMLSALALIGAAWAWLDKRRIDPWVRLHARVRASLDKLGIPTQSHDSPRTLAYRLRHQLGAPAEPLAQLLDSLDRLRYGPGGQAVPGPEWTRQYDAALAALRRQAQASPR